MRKKLKQKLQYANIPCCDVSCLGVVYPRRETTAGRKENMKGDLLLTSEGKYYREGDLPRAELIKMAEDAVNAVMPVEAEVHFKFTCEACGERCTFEEPDRIYESGICFACGHDTPFTIGGFMIAYKFGEPRSPRHPEQ